MLSEIILLAVALYFLYKWIKPTFPPNFPPGPENYPVIGGGLALQNHPVMGTAMINLGQKYGPLTGIYLGKSLGLIVNGYDAVKQVLMRDEFQSRPKILDPFFDHADKGKGIMFNNGESWKEQRRFSLRHLRDLGFGKSSMEGVIQDEIRACFQNLRNLIQTSDPREGVAIESIFGVSIVNVLWYVVSGKRFDHDDKEFREIFEKLTLSFRAGNNPAMSIISDYPFLRHLPYFKGVWDTSADGANAITGLMKDCVTEHKVARKVGNANYDYIHAYLQHLEDNKEDDNVSRHLNEQELIAVCADLFRAGGESTSNSLAFAMQYMLLYPDVQTKVQKEIDSVVGMDRFPSLDDRSELPYTEAVLDELFRLTPIAPLTVPHCTAADTELMGFKIPKDTMLLVNLQSVYMDKDYWGDPEVFRPERFIDAAGKFVRNERVLTFGIGKRSCPGESLARMNYFLFFTAMMQRFRLEMVPGKPKPSTVPLPGFTVAPQPFQAILISRH